MSASANTLKKGGAFDAELLPPLEFEIGRITAGCNARGGVSAVWKMPHLTILEIEADMFTGR